MAKRWTETALDREIAATQREFLSLGDGLYLRLPAEVFYWRLKRKGVDRKERLGKRDRKGEQGLALRDARRIASERNTSQDGSQSVSLNDLSEAWIASPAVTTLRRPDQLERYTKQFVLLVGGQRPAHLVTRREIVAALMKHRDVASSRGPGDGSAAASMMLRAARQLFRYGLTVGYLEADPTGTIKPGHLGLFRASNERVLTNPEILELWEADIPTLRLCRFLLLTGSRVAAATSMTWGQIADDRWHFELKAEGRRPKRAHWLHLPELTLQQLGPRGLPQDAVFRAPTGKALCPKFVDATVRGWNASHGRDLSETDWRLFGDAEREEMRSRIAWTPHDLRRTFVTRVSGFGRGWNDVAHLVAGHKRTGMSGIYDHSELEADRIEAAEKWAAVVKGLI